MNRLLLMLAEAYFAPGMSVWVHTGSQPYAGVIIAAPSDQVGVWKVGQWGYPAVEHVPFQKLRVRTMDKTKEGAALPAQGATAAWEVQRILAAEQFLAEMRKHRQFSVVRETETHVFFWKPLSAFDQWSPCRFEVDRQWYNCAEQYMMAEKAKLFGDSTTRAKVLSEFDPAVQKRLASARGPLRSFDEPTWERECQRIVAAGNRAKYRQNPELKAALLATAGKTLVEASPMDAIWGIGLGVQEALERDPSTWPGKNLLGRALMLVRDELLRS